MQEYFVPDHAGHCGDNICCLSAAMEFAEKVDGIVNVDFFQDVVELYNNPRLRFGTNGLTMHVFAAHKHRNKFPGLFINILGTYYAEFGLPIVDPVLRLPRFEPVEPRVLIQPFSRFALNPPIEYVQKIVDEFVRQTGLTVYVIGGLSTPRLLTNVDYSLLRDGVPFLMQQIQSAKCVLTPRSVSANLAAGYSRPVFMWSPPDGEDWHLNYSTWRGSRINFGGRLDESIAAIQMFIQRFGLDREFRDSVIKERQV